MHPYYIASEPHRGYSCVDDPIKFGCEMLAFCGFLAIFRLEKLLKPDNLRLSLLGGDQLSVERIDIRRDRSPPLLPPPPLSSGVVGLESRMKVEVRRMSFSAVMRGFSGKSSLMSSNAYDMRCSRLGFSMMEGSRCSSP